MRQPKFVPDKISKPDQKRPEPTCPIINELIQKAEEIRWANGSLRDNAEHWEEMARDYFNLAAQWETYALHLLEKLEEAERESA